MGIEHYKDIMNSKALLFLEYLVISPSGDVNYNQEYLRESSYNNNQLYELVL